MNLSELTFEGLTCKISEKGICLDGSCKNTSPAVRCPNIISTFVYLNSHENVYNQSQSSRTYANKIYTIKICLEVLKQMSCTTQIT